MAYQQQAVATATDIPGAVSAFANAQGWTVVGNQMTRPGGGLTFEITAQTVVNDNRVTVFDVADSINHQAWTRLPRVGASVDKQPTQLHMFAGLLPEPYIAVVIECGFNFYRHVYIGNLEKIGNYTGGEVICANHYNSSSGSSNPFTDTDNKYLFSARHNAEGGAGPTGVQSGGANIVHIDNINDWRIFDGPAGASPMDEFTGVEIIGGHSDGINAGLVYRASSPFGGSNILVPPMLWVPNGPDGLLHKFRPVGHPAGVRLCRVDGINPGTAIVIGAETWRVFPEFSKQTFTFVAKTGGNPYFDTETSYELGLAYREA